MRKTIYICDLCAKEETVVEKDEGNNRFGDDAPPGWWTVGMIGTRTIDAEEALDDVLPGFSQIKEQLAASGLLPPHKKGAFLTAFTLPGGGMPSTRNVSAELLICNDCKNSGKPLWAALNEAAARGEGLDKVDFEDA